MSGCYGRGLMLLDGERPDGDNLVTELLTEKGAGVPANHSS